MQHLHQLQALIPTPMVGATRTAAALGEVAARKARVWAAAAAASS